MNFRFTIAKKIGSAFGVLLIFIIIVFFTADITFSKSTAINEKIINVNIPSLTYLESIKLLTVKSQMLVFNWAYVQSSSDDPEKNKLIKIIKVNYPKIKKKVSDISSKWDEYDKNIIKNIFINLDELFVMYKDVFQLLPNFESYDDPANVFPAQYYLISGGDILLKIDEILVDLNSLINKQKIQTKEETEVMHLLFVKSKWVTEWLGLALFIFGVFVALFTIRSIVRPINKLKMILLSLSEGIFPKHSIDAKNDEIGEMTSALNRVISGLSRTKKFVMSVGSGKFDTDYEPLGNDDSLGLTLIKMRDDLAANERLLEQKVIERTAQVVEKQKQVEHQNKRINMLYKEVTASIRYAKGLQKSILPPDEFVSKLLPDSFILFKPKDIVSGDFYWVEEKNDLVYFAAVDCTGHGVPGAFMSIVGYNVLKESLKENDTPATILDALNKGVSESLHNYTSNSTTRDGMDLALCCYDKTTNILQYAGAYNPLYLMRDDEIIQFKPDKFVIGGYSLNPNAKYTNHRIQLEKGDYIYIFSDGYVDQFGGENEKKFLGRRFREHLLLLKNTEMADQKIYLNDTLEKWQGNLEQVDDILVFGFKIS